MHYSVRQDQSLDKERSSQKAVRPRPFKRPKMDRQEQRRLCERAAQGDEQAFKALYETYAPMLASYIFGVTNDKAIIEDVVNEAFFKAWRALGRFRGESDFGTWITTIARRILFDMYKKNQNTEDLSEVDDIPDDQSSPFENVSINGQAALIKKALVSLSPEHREVLQLMYMQGKSIQEIAELIDCPVNTVKTRIFHARKKLKKIIDKMGVSYDEI